MILTEDSSGDLSCGFMSNREERQWLRLNSRRQRNFRLSIIKRKLMYFGKRSWVRTSKRCQCNAMCDKKRKLALFIQEICPFWAGIQGIRVFFRGCWDKILDKKNDGASFIMEKKKISMIKTCLFLFLSCFPPTRRFSARPEVFRPEKRLYS